MSVLVAKVGRSGAGGANADYITRLNGAEKIAFHNLAHLESEEIHEARTNAIAYAHAREEIELEKGKKAKPKNKESSDEKLEKNIEISQQSEVSELQASDEESIELPKTQNVKEKNKHTKEKQIRTHYRVIASWEGKESSEKAVEEIKIYLQNQFPKAKAIIAIHQDTEDTHAHVWIDARQTDGRKIHLKEEIFEALDEKWTQQYDRTYGTNFAPEYKALKVETNKWKKEMYEWRKAKRENVEGAELKPEPIKPQRASDKFTTDYWREKEVKELAKVKIVGVTKNEEVSARTSYSDAQRTSGFADRGDKSIEGAEYFNHKTQQANGGGERANIPTESDIQRAIEHTGDPNQSDISNHQTSENSRTGFTKNETEHFQNERKLDVAFSGADIVTAATTGEELFEEQFHTDGLNGDQSGNGEFIDFIQRDYRRNSTIGKFNVELNQMPEIQYQVPQLQMDAQAMIENTVDLITSSLERQRREMDEMALALYREHLHLVATVPPSPSLIQKIEQFNRDSPKDDFIETENKSWLEANHEYLSSMTAQRLDKEAINIANEFEDDLEERQEWDPEYREEQGIDFGV